MRNETIGRIGFSSVRCAALFVSMFVLTSFGASLAKAQSTYNILCSGQQNTSSSLPFAISCSDTTQQGASFSASGDMSLVPGGITLGSKVSETGPSPSAGVLDNAHLNGTVVSDQVPIGTPLVLETWVSGSATDPAVPWGGTYSFAFQCDDSFCGSTQLQIHHSTAVEINGTVVVPFDAAERSSYFVICNPPFIAGEGCDKSASTGNGMITIAPRTGTYQTAVGSSISIDVRFSNGFNYGVPTAGTFSEDFDPPGLGFAAVAPTTGAPLPGMSLVLSDGTVIPLSSMASYSCLKFQSPFDIALSLPKKANRAIPLKAQLIDSKNNPVTPATLGSALPPVVNVSYQSGISPAVDDSALLIPLGSSTSGNQFNFDPATGTWWFNLSTGPFTASGTYTVTMQSGDVTRYRVSPICSGTFVRP